MSEWHKIFRNGPVLTHSPEEMRELGRQIGKILMPGEILGVVGELGAGKTHLTGEFRGGCQPDIFPGA